MRPRRTQQRSHSHDKNGKIDGLIRKIKHELSGSIDPISLPKLTSFERKLIHRHFDKDPDIATRTYRYGDEFELKIYPVGNLKRYAEEKAQKAIETGEKVVLPHMSDYERFVIHDALKDKESVRSSSYGEGNERHIEIEPDVFGRGLKRIIKRIRLF
jgi:predicted RNA-binding protein Jag